MQKSILVSKFAEWLDFGYDNFISCTICLDNWIDFLLLLGLDDFEIGKTGVFDD